MTDPNAKPAMSVADVLAMIAADGAGGDTGGALPDVEAWNPARCGDIGMEIRKDGRWWHAGRPIGRQRMVRLFSRILRRDADGVFYLVTPHEKVIVHVADTPFLAVRLDRADHDRALVFTTSLGDSVIAGHDHPLRVETDPRTGAPSPRILVRGRLEAKLTRPVFYELAAMAVTGPDRRPGVWSGGCFFPLADAAV